MSEKQVGFHVYQGCIDGIFTFQQILINRHIFFRPTVYIVFSMWKQYLTQSVAELLGVPAKFILIFRSLYLNSFSRIHAYADFSYEFIATCSSALSALTFSLSTF